MSSVQSFLPSSQYNHHYWSQVGVADCPALNMAIVNMGEPGIFSHTSDDIQDRNVVEIVRGCTHSSEQHKEQRYWQLATRTYLASGGQIFYKQALNNTQKVVALF